MKGRYMPMHHVQLDVQNRPHWMLSRVRLTHGVYIEQPTYFLRRSSFALIISFGVQWKVMSHLPTSGALIPGL